MPYGVLTETERLQAAGPPAEVAQEYVLVDTLDDHPEEIDTATMTWTEAEAANIDHAVFMTGLRWFAADGS